MGNKENYELIRAIRENDTTNVIKYLDEGCSPNPTGQFEPSPLMTALEKLVIDFSIFKQLLEYGADPNWEDSYEKTPFKEALKKQNRPLVKLMLEYKADPNQAFVLEPSPFEEVVRRGDIESIKLLIEHGAVINQPNREGKTPLEIAFLMGNPQVVNALKYYGAVLPGLQQDDAPVDNPAFDRLMAYIGSFEEKIENLNIKVKLLEEQNIMLKKQMLELQDRPVSNPSKVTPNAIATPIYNDYGDDDTISENTGLPVLEKAYDEDFDSFLDSPKKYKTCMMCAGTGFMGAGESETDETGCDEVTCPYCCGSGIE